MSQTMQVFYENGLLPVVVIDDADNAVPLAQALLRGGISAIEITLRTDYGVKAIERIHREVPEIYVGAGTVINCEKADRRCSRARGLSSVRGSTSRWSNGAKSGMFRYFPASLLLPKWKPL